MHAGSGPLELTQATLLVAITTGNTPGQKNDHCRIGALAAVAASVNRTGNVAPAENRA